MIWPLRMVLTPVQASPWRSRRRLAVRFGAKGRPPPIARLDRRCSLEAWRGRRSAGGVEGADEVGGDVCRIL